MDIWHKICCNLNNDANYRNMLKKTVRKYLLSTSLIFSLFVFSLFFSHLGVDNLGQSNYSDYERKDKYVFRNVSSKPDLQNVRLRINIQEDADSFIRKYLINLYPSGKTHIGP